MLTFSKCLEQHCCICNESDFGLRVSAADAHVKLSQLRERIICVFLFGKRGVLEKIVKLYLFDEDSLS